MRRAAANVARRSRQPVPPDEERLWVQQQRAQLHAVAGNRTEALRVCANCQKLVRDELGAEPSEQTAAVFLSILRAE